MRQNLKAAIFDIWQVETWSARFTVEQQVQNVEIYENNKCVEIVYKKLRDLIDILLRILLKHLMKLDQCVILQHLMFSLLNNRKILIHHRSQQSILYVGNNVVHF